MLAAEPRGTPPATDATAPAIVEVRGLKIWSPIKRGLLRRTTGHIRAVDGIDLTIRCGETLGAVGESGSGKSTLGYALLRLPPSSGRILVLGNQLQSRSWKAMRPLRVDLQIVFQDPFGSLSPRLSVDQIIGEGLAVHQPHLSAAERDARVVIALEEVGLPPQTRFRYPHEFSGGQRQRIAIARAMVLSPKFVALDEPTSALDVSIQAQVVDLLRDLQQRHGLTYMFISHDLKVVRALANQLIVMRDGRIVEQGPAAIFAAPQSDYTQTLMAAAFNIATVGPQIRDPAPLSRRHDCSYPAVTVLLDLEPSDAVSPLLALALICGLAAPATPQTPTDVWTHAFSMQDEPKYTADYSHFDYFNADAPRQAGCASASQAASTHSIPFCPRANPPGELGLVYETLMTPSEDEVNTYYGLLAKSLKIAPPTMAR